MRIAILVVVLVTLILAGLGIVASDLSWPLPTDSLVPLGLYMLAVTAGMGLMMLLVILMIGQARQQLALQQSLEAQRHRQRSMETGQLMERFIYQAEILLEKDSLDPNKRSVQRCLAIDALRGNGGRGDPNYQRLARLFEWLADEADETRNDAAQQRLIEPVLRQYAETAEQLCRIGESQEERLAAFFRYQPQAPRAADKTA